MPFHLALNSLSAKVSRFPLAQPNLSAKDASVGTAERTRLYHLYDSPSRNLNPNERQIRKTSLQLLVAVQRTYLRTGEFAGDGGFSFFFLPSNRSRAVIPVLFTVIHVRICGVIMRCVPVPLIPDRPDPLIPK